MPFLQIMKYVGRGKAGIQLDFPRAEWAEPHWSEVEARLTRFGALPTRGWNEAGHDMPFMTVDFGQDVPAAAECIENIGEGALGIQLFVDGRAHLLNVSPDPNVRIGF